MIFDHPLAWSDEKIYNEIYKNSIENPDEFWGFHSDDIYWKQKPINTYNHTNKKWLDGGISNVCYNCLDRHLKKNPNKTAIIWYGDTQEKREEISYLDLYNIVLKISSILKENNIKKGDVVGIYMPMHYISIAAILACSRIGAIHLVIFAGFSYESLAYRLDSSNARLVLTLTSFNRSGKKVKLLENVKKAINLTNNKPKIIILDDIDKNKTFINDDKIEWVNSCDDLFILYTSGSSGKPKKIVHSTFPYLLYISTTFKLIFSIKEDDVYFCTSDIGWITGHSYITYAPLFFGSTIVIFEGSPTYPNPDRYWQIIENENVSIFYTSPTSIRSLKMFNDTYFNKHDLSSLRLMGSVGEPIDKSSWIWYFEKIGKKRCPIIDTWWQTETGGIILAPLRNLNQKPGFVGKPFFGIKPKIIDSKLFIENDWPGKCKNISENNNDDDNDFITGDCALIDDDGNFKVTGRFDDVINISGHRLSTSEFEDAINKIYEIKESAVVAIEHDIKGQCAFVYVVLNLYNNKDIEQKIIDSIKCSIGPIAKPDYIAFVKDLPKTRSGKIVRNILKEIAQNKDCGIQDLSSVINPESINQIKNEIKNAIYCPDMCKL